MKKLGALLIVGTLFLTGCGGNKVVCSSTIKEDGHTYGMKITAKMKDNKVSSIDAEMNFDTEDSANEMCSTLALINGFTSNDNEKLDYKCSGKKITIKNYEKLASSDDDKLVGLTKDEFVKTMTEDTSEDNKVTCK